MESIQRNQFKIEIIQYIKLILFKCKLQNRTGKSNIETFDMPFMREG